MLEAAGLSRACPRRTWRTPDGVLASIDHVAQTAAEKALLRAAGASAVEMEAGGVAQFAATHGIPLFCVRSVTDTAGQSFVNDFNKALLSDGHFGTIKLLTSAFEKSWKGVPGIVPVAPCSAVLLRVH